jgi:dihydroneopterin aldolase
MFTVALESMRFFAGHGLHPEEQLTGNHFEISVKAELTDETSARDIQDTVDYESAYQIVREVMKKPHRLLEEICLEISAGLKDKFPIISATEVKICKLNPPLGGQAAGACVTLSKKY